MKSDERNKYIDDDRSGIFPKQKIRQLYNAKYQKKYYKKHYVLDRYYIKDTRKRRVHSGRKQKATGFVYLKGSPYRDDEGSSQII